MLRVGYRETVEIGRLRDARPAFQFLSAGLVAVAKDRHRVITQWKAKRRLCDLCDLQDRCTALARISRLLAVHSFHVTSNHSHRGGVSFDGRGIAHRCSCPIGAKTTRLNDRHFEPERFDLLGKSLAKTFDGE